ncbi:VRR-NUC domain-containing protein [Comamonas nitrativorans]|uniref:VRR-NUC domain-containing protein n=1 Tax=Comamonas nitrativorans TaxID=108437 RepID=A0ABV9GTU8_9BURK
MKKSSLRHTAEKFEIPYIDISLSREAKINSWISPIDCRAVRVEDAVLDSFKLNGWRGYSGEGGLILNLIKAMSFEQIAPRNRSTCIEALYAQNVAFDEDRFSPEELLNNVAKADARTIERNFDLMASRENISYKLDYFPGLERWMFIELFKVTGNELIYNIASKFIQAPYEYRRGWPDLTIWRDNELKFVEVKAPRDKLQNSQKVIIKNFAKPFGLNFVLAGVIETNA